MKALWGHRQGRLHLQAEAGLSVAGLSVCDGLAQPSGRQCQGQGDIYDGLHKEHALVCHCDKVPWTQIVFCVYLRE